MSKAFIARTIQNSLGLSGTAARKATNDLLDAIVEELRVSDKFTIPGFGTFRVVQTKEHEGVNPRTGELITVKAGKIVRFKVSPLLKRSV